jgi:methylase of polypeptide subunit release factors
MSEGEFRWRSEAGVPPPKHVREAGDTIAADAAFRLASEGVALAWRGDYHNARQLLAAMARRADRKKPKAKPASLLEAFHLHRKRQAERARILGRLLVPVDGEHRVPLPRAPDVRAALDEAWGPPDGQPSLVALRELLGIIGAHEWRRKGVEIPALGGARIHPHYGVFSPVRGEYLDLVAAAPLPSTQLAFDVGTGTGVIAAVLAARGVQQVVATDTDERALACARENVERLGLAARVQVVRADLFPEGTAPLVVCNPPWLPGRASAPVERAIYDEDSRMLRGFLAGARAHLAPRGEAWLVMSDLAERIGLRAPGELEGWIAGAGLAVIAKASVRPRHPKAIDPADPLHAARSQESTSLWRLGADAK